MHKAIISKVYPTKELIESSEGDYMASTLQDFTNQVISKGHQVTIIADHGGEKPQNPRVVNTEPWDAKGFRYLSRIPSTWHKLREENRREEIDLVLTWDWSGVIPGWLFSRQSKPLVCSLRGLMPADFNRKGYGLSETKYRFYRLIEKQISLCDLVIANSSNTAESIHEDVRTEIVHNGVNYDHFSNAEPKQIEYDKFTIGYFGRFSPEKGLETLIESLEHHDVKLLMFGDGEMKESLIEKAMHLGVSEKIVWMGIVPPEEVASYMKVLDATILPSRIEGFGSVILESMAAGTPVICSKGTGGRDIIEEGKNGFLIDAERPQQLAEKISNLKENPELAETISRNGKKTAKYHTWEQFTDRYIQLFQEFL